MNINIKDNVSLDIQAGGAPIWSHIYVNGGQETLTRHELKSLIAACEKILREWDRTGF